MAARSSLPGAFRNFRRAGVLWKRSRTSTVVPGPRATRPRSTTSPPSTRTNAAASSPAVRELNFIRLTAAMLGSASPRKPSESSRSRSSSVATLDVAWRSSASSSSAGAIPAPSSATLNCWSSVRSIRISIDRAPASSAFSTSSFNAESGRSMTSPAAMRDAVSGGSLWIDWDTEPPGGPSRMRSAGRRVKRSGLREPDVRGGEERFRVLRTGERQVTVHERRDRRRHTGVDPRFLPGREQPAPQLCERLGLARGEQRHDVRKRLREAVGVAHFPGQGGRKSGHDRARLGELEPMSLEAEAVPAVARDGERHALAERFGVEPARLAVRGERKRRDRARVVLAIPQVAQLLEHRVPGAEALARVDRRAGQHAAPLHGAERPRRPGAAAAGVGHARHDLRRPHVARELDETLEESILRPDLRHEPELRAIARVHLGGARPGAGHELLQSVLEPEARLGGGKIVEPELAASWRCPGLDRARLERRGLV